MLILVGAALGIFATAAAPASANTITANCSPAPSDCSASWYTSPVDLSWAFDTQPDVGTDNCDPQTVNESGTPAGTTVTCTGHWTTDPTDVSQPVTIHVDTTDPSVDGANADRPTDSNGWFNHTVTFNFFGSDALSGLDSCSSNVTYSGPDSTSASVNGTCHDVAGNSASDSHTFKYDETKPTVTGANFARGADSNGWFNHPVGYTFTGTDNLSGIDASTCTSGTYSGVDGSAISLPGTCDDNAGNTDSGTQALKYDATDPTITGATFGRATDANGWFNHAVGLTFHGTDTTSGIDNSSCSTPTYSGPDSATASQNGTCDDLAGNTGSGSQGFKYDDTKPTTTTGTPGRAANANGWYNAPISFNFAGTDVTSGIASCQSGVTYSTPDSATASVAGHCTDNAGNVGDDLTKALKYDATKPVITGTTPARAADSPAGWFNHSIQFTFNGTDNLSGIDTCSTPTYNGPDSGTASVSGTCTDNASNISLTGQQAVKYDATAPVTGATPAPGRAADHAGWYNHAVSFTYGGTDATSGINTCPTPSYGGPDSATASVSGACTDKAGNTGNTVVQGLKYDGTLPTINSATPGRAPDHGGWYNAPITFTFGGTDPTSGIDSASCQAKTYSGPASATASLSGHCSDNAGNVGADFISPSFQFDNVAPTTPTVSPDRAPDTGTNGWYNHPVTFTFTSTDAVSGMAPCPTVNYSGPESPAASVSSHCTDNAGNASPTAQQALKYDSVKPTVTGATPERAPNANGWFNAPIKFHYQATDATSGVAACDAPTYSTPDSATASVTGTCVDAANNVGTALPVSLKYDATPPDTTTTALGRPPDQSGWYNHPVTVLYNGTDNLSGFSNPSVCGSVVYGGPAGTGVSTTGGCTDLAGNTDPTKLASPTFNYDASAPAIAGAVPDRAPDSHGWYNHPVSFAFQGADNVSGLAGCSSGVVYAGPDGSGAHVAGSCADNAGNSASGSVSLLYDHTPPKVLGALPDRLPDHDGWFNHPVKLAFQGTDTASGIASCSHYTFSGPGSTKAAVSGTCVDAAGNSSTASFSMKYDATPPPAATMSVTPGNGRTLITWTKPAGAVAIRVTRSRQSKVTATKAIYSGKATSFVDKHLRNGTDYVYTVTTLDQAGNAANATASATPTALSLRPLPGAVVSGPPKLTWKKVRHAHYYNVQLFAGNTKVLSTWPKTTSYQLRGAWLYNGRPYSLVPGLQYHWYVWPGIGARSKNRYGHMLGKSTFTLTG